MKDPIVNVRPAVDLAALAREIKSAVEAGHAARKRGLQHYITAGNALLKAKAACGHGNWLDWLKANVDLGGRQVRRYIAFAEVAKLDVTSNLEETWRTISGNDEDETEPPEREPGCDEPDDEEEEAPVETIFCRPCRVSGRPKPGCKDCIIARQQHGNESSNGSAGGGSKGVKAGAPAFDPKAFTEYLGKALAEISKLAHEAGLSTENKKGQAPSVIETAEMKRIRELMEQVQEEVQAWVSNLRSKK